MTTRAASNAPTIKDVALACGVSEATVSYVINGKRVLRPDTREKVFRVMREMNYHPSAVARGLQSKCLYTIGVLLGAVDPSEWLSNPYAGGILQGVIQEAKKEKFHVTLFTEAWIDIAHSASMVRDGRTDGILVVAPQLHCDVLDSLRKYHRTVVAISAVTDGDIDMVDVDNAAGIRLAVRHLVALGHRRIGYLTGNADMASHRPRFDAFRKSLEAAGIPIDETLIVESAFDGSMAFEQANQLLARNVRPTAIVAGNDSIAIGVIKAAHAAGLNVPRELSVVGFDDQPAATLVTPNLTTVHQPVSEIGAAAARILIGRILNRHRNESAGTSAQNVLVPPRLVVRDSTGPCPTMD